MSAGLLGLYRPGSTPLHRLRAGTKLVALFVAGIVVVAVRGPASGVAALVAAVALVVWSGMGVRVLLRTLRGILLVAVALAAYQAWQQGWPRAVESVADLVALVLLATVLTVTTPIDEILDAVTAALRPWRRWGWKARPDVDDVDPEKTRSQEVTSGGEG